MADENDFAVRLAAVFANQFAEIVRSRVQSRTIQKSLFVLIDPTVATAAVVAGPYWAGYYHNGRAGFSRRGGGILVWFKDPTLDPRRPTNITSAAALNFTGRRLTKREFQFAKKAGLLVIARKVGPAAPHPFFLDAEPEFLASIDLTAAAATEAEILRVLKKEAIAGLEGPSVAPAAKLRL